MLTLEQIMALTEKGFTYEQMQTLNVVLASEPEKTEPEKSEPKKTEPEKSKPEKNEPKKTEKEQSTLESKIDALSETIKQLQAVNVKNAAMDAPKNETAEDVIRSFMQAS